MLDSGALYRLVAHASERAGIDIADAGALARVAQDLPVSFETGAGDEGESDSGPLLDVGAGDGGVPTGETGTGTGCAKVDFLFVIDNSNSMAEEQQRLVDAFPGFIASIEDTLGSSARCSCAPGPMLHTETCTPSELTM